MSPLSSKWIAPRVRGQRGILACATLFALQALAAFVSVAIETGVIAPLLLLAWGGVSLYVALGLLRALKPAWHFATFLLFLSIVLSAIGVACAPGEMADGELHFFEMALNVVMLTIFILAYAYLRRPGIRDIYGVPQSYRQPQE